jgi:hypothetical protein
MSTRDFLRYPGVGAYAVSLQNPVPESGSTHHKKVTK